MKSILVSHLTAGNPVERNKEMQGKGMVKSIVVSCSLEFVQTHEMRWKCNKEKANLVLTVCFDQIYWMGFHILLQGAVILGVKLQHWQGNRYLFQ